MPITNSETTGKLKQGPKKNQGRICIRPVLRTKSFLGRCAADHASLHTQNNRVFASTDRNTLANARSAASHQNWGQAAPWPVAHLSGMKSAKASRRTKPLADPQIPTESFKQTLLACVKGGGKILLDYFGKTTNPRLKESASSVVCDADLASEKVIIEQIQQAFPEHSIVSEESGSTWRPAEYTWIIDPLDGTSNFVAGIPWFGVQIGILRVGSPILAAMYLPVEDALYYAELGRGAWRNGKKIQVTPEPSLAKVLCAFGFDPQPGKRSRQRVELLFRVAGAVRNTRATNSLVDFCYTADGRLGGCINLQTKIWDIVPIALILPEAGGKFSYLDGKEIVFQLDANTSAREYPVLGAARQLHPKLLEAVKLAELEPAEPYRSSATKLATIGR